jgi:hypothetical protein
MLSIYELIKPPVCGNCRAESGGGLNFNDFKLIFSENSAVSNRQSRTDNKSRQGPKFGTILFVLIKYQGKIPTKKKYFVCNRTRNEHFACLEQAAKLNFAAVALTTAVKVKVISIFIYYHNYNISISIFAV